MCASEEGNQFQHVAAKNSVVKNASKMVMLLYCVIITQSKQKYAYYQNSYMNDQFSKLVIKFIFLTHPYVVILNAPIKQKHCLLIIGPVGWISVSVTRFISVSQGDLFGISIRISCWWGMSYVRRMCKVSSVTGRVCSFKGRPADGCGGGNWLKKDRLKTLISVFLKHDSGRT